MNFFKKILIIFFLLPIATSFAAMVEINQRTTINERNVLDAGTGSDHQDFGVAAGIGVAFVVVENQTNLFLIL